ncbi:hypothetical protein DFH08DRAFT_818974 [Mycena albidolilacea]|uniref:Uncharacterized protein n=1 Tax=Mycena albidolilacea TaxID=1033008 RepID=A0AAD6ZEU5_9AGAR|nr:hypothetical protein DFH08DRAFT_818974 [Mycena albidolilacea]
MGKWIGRWEDTMAALGQSRGRMWVLVGGGVSDLALDLLAWAPARWGHCVLALVAQGGRELHTSTDVVKHDWLIGHLLQGKVKETKCTTVYRLPHFGHAGTGGREEHSGLGQRMCRMSIFIVSRTRGRGITKKGGREELEGGHLFGTSVTTALHWLQFKLHEEAVGRWQCLSRYGRIMVRLTMLIKHLCAGMRRVACYGSLFLEYIRMHAVTEPRLKNLIHLGLHDGGSLCDWQWSSQSHFFRIKIWQERLGSTKSASALLLRKWPCCSHCQQDTTIVAQPFLWCYKPAAHANTYNHRWPPLARPTIAPMTSMAPPMTVSALSKIPCRYPAGCKSGWTNKHCMNNMCQKHCFKTGNSSSSSLTPVSSNMPFPAHIPVFSGARPFRSFDDLASNLNKPLCALNAYQEAQNSVAHQFDLSIGLKSPSPDLPLEEELCRQEEKDIKEAMHQSARDAEQARCCATFQDIIDTVTKPSPPPVPTTNLRLCSLSPSPDPPATILPISHAKKCSITPIQITKQLSNNWIKPSSTFHVAAPSQRSPTNPELSAEDPVVLCISAADLPSWPQFRLANSPQTPSDMGIKDIDNTSLEQYSESYHIFMKVSVHHLFTLMTNCVVLLRKQGVHVLDEATIITCFLGCSTPPTSSHLHYGLSQECAGVCYEYRKLKSTLSDNGSDVELVGTIRKRNTTKMLQRKHPHLPVNTAIVPINIDDNSNTSMQSTPPLTTPPLTPDLSCSSAAGSKNDKGSWMKGLYVVDMVDRFVKMDSPELMHLLTKEAHFHAVFGREHSYAPSTYDNQLQHWRSVAEAKRQRALEGRTSKGLWTVFTKNHSLRR